MATIHTHTGALPLSSPHAPLRFLSTYLTTLSSPSDLSTIPAPTFFAPTATLHTSTGQMHRSATAVWTAVRAERERFDYVHWQPCVTRVFGMGESTVVSCQAVALVRLKGFEEEKVVEVPVCWEGVLGGAVEEEEEMDERERQEGGAEAEDSEGDVFAITPPTPTATTPTPGTGDAAPTQLSSFDPMYPTPATASKQPRQRRKSPGTDGMQLFECRTWWDSGVLAQAEKEREREEEKRKFREVMGLNRGFLGMGRRLG